MRVCRWCECDISPADQTNPRHKSMHAECYREYVRIQVANWCDDNREHRKAYQRQWMRSYRERVREA